MVGGKQLVAKDSSNTNNSKGDDWSEYVLKNSVEKPSGPGDSPLHGSNC